MYVRGINKVKRELGCALMALNIRKIAAQRAAYDQNNYKQGNFYIISTEIAFFTCPRTLCPRLSFIYITV
jgi:hypothetical protein